MTWMMVLSIVGSVLLTNLWLVFVLLRICKSFHKTVIRSHAKMIENLEKMRGK